MQVFPQSSSAGQCADTEHLRVDSGGFVRLSDLKMPRCLQRATGVGHPAGVCSRIVSKLVAR